ncbi:MAG: type II toxin-antitoxin system RelE/ParE family toxin [Candidatus Marinimicrobia bacterium]|nr:type II toxin-antitoxin system RelE/ParE family toxin [Candidatus Neomarinimicrobiota bacterium]
MYKIFLTPPAQKDFNNLKKKNPPVFKRIVTKLKSLAKDPGAGKPLVGLYKGVRSLRIGTYRILYEVSEDKIHVYSIKHRKDAYR